MRSLVTGGAGFLGSHVAKHLRERGHDVTVLDDLSGGFADQVPAGVQLVQGSINDVSLVQSVFHAGRFDYVFHLAAYAAEGLSHFIRRFNYENNVVGSVNLINESVRVGVKRFVFTSSIAVYGSGAPPFAEVHVPKPEDPYGIAKYAVEMDLKAAHDMFGMEYTVLRPHNVYGPHQNLGDPYRNVVGIFMRQVMAGKPLTIFGDGLQRRAFTYVDDVAPFIAAMPDTDGTRNETFNVGGDVTCTVLELAERVSAAFEVSPCWVHLPPRREVREAWCDHTKFDAVFTPGRRVPLDIGIARMSRWASAAGIRTEQRRVPELTLNLPESWR